METEAIVNRIDQCPGIGSHDFGSFREPEERILRVIQAVNGIGQLTAGDAAVEHGGELVDVRPGADGAEAFCHLLDG